MTVSHNFDLVPCEERQRGFCIFFSTVLTLSNRIYVTWQRCHSDVASHWRCVTTFGHTRANSHAGSRLAPLPHAPAPNFHRNRLSSLFSVDCWRRDKTHLAFVLRKESRRNVSPLAVSDELREKKCYEFTSFAELPRLVLNSKSSALRLCVRGCVFFRSVSTRVQWQRKIVRFDS